MASSGTAWGNVAAASGSYAAGVRLRLDWKQISQDQVANSTKIRLTLYVVSGVYGHMIGTAPQTWSISCNGQKSNGSFTIQQGDNVTRQLGTLDVTISHNSNGDATFSASATASFNMDFNGWVGSKSVSLRGTLNHISRASICSVSGTLQMGSEITIKTNRNNSSWTHTVKYNFQGHQAVIAEDVGTSCKWTPDLATFAGWLPTAASAKCTIVCNTYSGSTLIGTTETTFTLKVPNSVVPKFTSSTVTDAAGYFDEYGGYVQGCSDIRVSAQAEGQYGSTITKITVSLDGVTDSGKKTSFVLGAPSETGNRTISLTATDSRGRSIKGTKSITVLEYGLGEVNISADRWNQETDAQEDESTTVRIVLSGNFFDVGLNGANTGQCVIKYYEGTVPVGDATTLQTVTLANEFESVVYVQDMSETKSWYFVATFTDSLGGIFTRAATVGNATPALDFRGDGTGLGIFAISDYEGLKIGGNIKLKPAAGTIATKIQMDNWDGTLRDFVEFQSDGSLGIGANVVLNEQGLGYWMTRNVGSGSSAAKLPFQALYTDSNGKVCMTWNDGGLRGKCYTRIWSGTCSGANGSVTVSSIDDYNLFSVMCADNVSIICQRRTAEDTIIAGSGGTHTGSQAQIYVLRMQESTGGKLSVRCYAMAVNANGIGAPVAKNITNIVGIL